MQIQRENEQVSGLCSAHQSSASSSRPASENYFKPEGNILENVSGECAEITMATCPRPGLAGLQGTQIKPLECGAGLRAGQLKKLPVFRENHHERPRPQQGVSRENWVFSETCGCTQACAQTPSLGLPLGQSCLKTAGLPFCEAQG